MGGNYEFYSHHIDFIYLTSMHSTSNQRDNNINVNDTYRAGHFFFSKYQHLFLQLLLRGERPYNFCFIHFLILGAIKTNTFLMLLR